MNIQKLSLGLILAITLTAVAVRAQSTSRPVLRGQHVPRGVAQLPAAGPLQATQSLALTLGLPLRDQAGLDSLLQELYDPASPNYRHFLTPEQFTERFGPTKEDYAAVVAYARASGFTVDPPDPGRVLVSVHAPVAKLEKVFHVHMHYYQHPTETRQFFAPDVEPTLDLDVPLQDIGGLDNYVVPHPAGLVKKPLPQTTGLQSDNPIPLSGSGTSGTYAGKDFRAAYAPGVTLTGTGQSVGLFEFGGYFSNDIVQYENTFESGSQVPIVNVLLNSVSNITNNPSAEEALDIEMQIAMAPGMTSLYYYFGSSADTMLSRIASDNAVHQVSASWLYGTDGSTDGFFQQLAAQGITFFNSAGDGDAYPVGTSIDACCSSPFVTSVGGTTLSTTGAGGSWSSETVWNWGGGTGGSGGISTSYSIPSWQTGISMNANQGSPTMRNIPDVALTADNIYVWYNGSWEDVGGTSCAAPLWAGFMALINEQAANSGLSPVGAFNPTVYAIGKSAFYSAAFHDIATGNNFKTASPTNFSAVAGYDLCTGWGTPQGQATINALAPPTALQISPLAGFVSAGWPGGPFSVNSQLFVLTNISSTLSFNWSLSNTSTWLTVSATSGTLVANGSTNVTVSLNSTVINSLTAGNYSANIVFTSQSITQTRSFSLFIGSNFAGWSGSASPIGNWSAPGNWLGNTAPTNGTNLLFTGSAQSVNTNDAIAAAGWVLLKPGVPFTFSGNALSITNGMTNAAQNNFWNIPLALGASQNFDVASNTTLTVGAVVSGGSRLTKTSAGTLVLSASNTYTGPTTISAGTLMLGGAGTLGNGTYAGNVTNNSAFIYSSTAADTLSGVISGPGTLTQQGSGNLILSGANTYSGPTTINTGSILAIGLGGSLGAGNNYTNIISGGGGLTYSGPGSQILSAVNTYSGPTLVNSGVLVLADSGGGSAGTIGSSAITVNNGAEMDLNNQDVLGYASTSPLIICGTVKKTYNQAETLFRPITLAGGVLTNTLTTSQNAYELFGGYVAAAANTTNAITGPGQFGLRTSTAYFTNALGSVLNISAVIYPYTSGCPLNKLGPGTLVLSAPNTYSGNTVVGGGTLALTGSASIASSPSILIAPSAMFDVSGLASTFTLGSSQSLTAGNAGAVITNVNGSLTSGGTINIAATGTNGTLTINGNLALTGGTLLYDFGNGSDLISLAGTGRTLSLSGTTVIQASLGLNNGTYPLITNLSSLPTGTVANLAFIGTVVRGGTTAFNVAAPAVTLTVSGGAAANLVWQGTNGLNWDASTTNWLNSGTGQPDQFYSLDNVTFNDTGTANVSLVGALYPATVTVSSANTNYNFGGPGSLGGTAALSLTGASTLSISNNNSFAGGTTISAGTLRAASSNALGNGPLAMTGGTLDLNATNLNIQSLSGTSGAVITDLNTNESAAVTRMLTASQTGSNTFAGVINKGVSNNIALIKNGSGYLLLSGANTYGGGATVNAGTLEVTGNSGAKNYVVAQGAAFKLGYSIGASYGNSVTVNGSGVNDPSGLYLKGGISVNEEATSGSSGIILTTAPSTIQTYGSGNATLNGFDINYTMLTVNAGASGSVLASAVSIACSSYGYNINIASGANTATGDLLIGGVISGSGSVTRNGLAVNLEKFGTGSVLLTNVSTSTGYWIGAGTIMLAGGNNRLPGTSSVVLGNGGSSGVLQLNGVNQTLAAVVSYGSDTGNAVVGGSSTLSILTINNSATLTNAAAIGGTSVYQNNISLIKTGVGQLVLSGPLLYTGNTTINGGTILAGSFALADGATLSLADAAGTLAATNLTLGAFTGGTVAISNFASAVSAPIVATNLTVNGVTTFVLSGTFSAGEYPLVQFLSGTISGSGSFGVRAIGLPRGYSAVIVTNMSNQSIDVVITANNPLVWMGATNGVNVSTWDKGTTTNWSLVGAPSYFTNGDSVQLDDSAIGSTTLNLTTAISPSAILVTNNVRTYTISATGAATLTGGMSLTKIGSGLLILAESNSFTGGATISGGTLLLTGSLGTNATTVATNATLAGNGVINGIVAILAGGSLQPGLGGLDTSTLVVSNNLNLAGNVLFVLNRTNLQNSSRVAGVKIATYGGALSVTNAGSALLAGDSFALFSAASYAGNFNATNLPSLNLGLQWNWNPAAGTLAVIQPVNTAPTNITCTFSGGVLQLSWPPDHAGWRLLVQTNNLAAGCSSNTNDWTTVTGSAVTNEMSIPISTTNPAEFYRLVFP